MKAAAQPNAYPNSGALRAARAVVRALDFLHPPLAGKAVYRLFCTPFSKSPSEAGRRALSQAERHALIFGEKKLVAYSWGSGPSILLLHGWGSNAGSMRHLALPLSKAGFRAIALDAPAHGASPGTTTTAVEYGEAIRTAITKYAPIHLIVAHSFGATCALFLLAENADLEVGGVAVNNPPAHVGRLIDIFAEILGLSERGIRSLHRKIQDSVHRPVEYFSLLNHAKSLAPPGLVIADREDTLASFGDSQRLASDWPRGRLVVTEGLGHHGALRDSGVIEDVVRFAQEGCRLD